MAFLLIPCKSKTNSLKNSTKKRNNVQNRRVGDTKPAFPCTKPPVANCLRIKKRPERHVKNLFI